jgi:hypothetical protein
LNKKILALSLLIVLMSVYLTSVSISPVKAQTTAPQTSGTWITQYTIADASTGVAILTKDVTTGTTSGNGQISEGEELEVTVTIDVPVSGPSSLTLGTSMMHSALQSNMYWQLVTTGYNLGNFNPNSRSISFPETAGTFQISCFGLIPSGIVQQQAPNGITLDIPTPISLVLLQDPSGNILDQVKLNVTDAAIDNYLNLLSQKQTSLKSLQSSGVDPGYISIYSSVISTSEALEGEGFASEAATMLNGLNVSAPPSAGMQALFIPIAGVLAAVAVVFAFLFLRIRGKVSYFQLVVEDQIKDLEGLTLRISKIDRVSSSSLESVKDRLKRLVGM